MSDVEDDIYGSEPNSPAPITSSVSLEEPQPIQPAQPALVEQRLDSGSTDAVNLTNGGVEEHSDDGEGEEDVEEDDSDVEIIIDTAEKTKSNANLTRDFRQEPVLPSPTVEGTSSKLSAPHLTTEYIPTPRGEPIPRAAPPQPQPPVDPSTLPPARAPPSAPPINLEAPGIYDGRPILDVEMDALMEKPWRRPGSDLSDWFNYGFDEVSWEAYCYRRRDVGDVATLLKGAVTNFSGMPEEQITQLPPEVRAMVMSGTTALMNGGGPMGPGAMPPQMMGVVPGPGGQMMQMHPEMGMGVPMMNVPMNGEMQPNPEGENAELAVQNAQAAQGGIPSGPVDGGIQDPQPIMAYQNAERVNTPTQPQPPSGPAGRGAGAFRGAGRGAGIPATAPRGRGAYGRGRGAYGGPPVPVRPASPLPPGVPTGPRNQNRYKDRDGYAPANEGLDYGGTTNAGGDDERSSSRKRRGSPPDEGRSSKRR